MASLRLLGGNGRSSESLSGDGPDETSGAELPISVATKAYNASFDDGDDGVQYGEDAGLVEIANGKPVGEPPVAALVLQLD